MTAQAQLANYTFGSGASPSGTVTTSASGLSTSAFGINASATLVFTSASPASSSIGGSGAGIASGSGFNQSIATNYFSATITPDTLKSINVSSITFNSFVSSSGPTGWSLSYTTDGGATLNAITSGTNSSSGWVNQTSGSISLTHIITSMEFRLYGYGATASNGAFRVDDFIVNGTVSAIPEFETHALLGGLAILGFVAFRRTSKGKTKQTAHA